MRAVCMFGVGLVLFFGLLGNERTAYANRHSLVCGESMMRPMIFASAVELASYLIVLGGNTLTLAGKHKKRRVHMGIAGLTISSLAMASTMVTMHLWSPPGCNNGSFWTLEMAVLNIPLLAYSAFTLAMGVDTQIARWVGIGTGAGTFLFSGASVIGWLAAKGAWSYALLLATPGLVIGLGLMIWGLLIRGEPSTSSNKRIALLPWLAPTHHQKGIQGGCMLQGQF